jgi:hypothetical protein
MRMTRVVGAALLLAGVAFATPRGAAAGDAPASNDAATQADAVVKEIEAGLAAKDEAAIMAAVKKVSPIYKSTQDNAIQGRLMGALGKVAKQSKMTGARKDAYTEMVATEDGKAAWRQIASSYPADDLDDPTRWNCEYVGFVGALHPEDQGAIDKLLESFKKGKSAEFAAKAVEALGKYHKSKKREAIFEEIVKAGKNMVPSRSASKAPSPEAQARWQTVGEGIGKALDELTGTKIGSPTDWFKKADEAKKNYKQFFVD